jgi:hypothetical protein
MQRFHIRQSSRSRKASSSRDYLGYFSSALGCLIAPFVLLGSLLFAAFLTIAALFGTLTSWVTGRREVPPQAAIPPEPWITIGEYAQFTLEKRFEDELRFGPAYYRIRSTPRIPELEGCVYGEGTYPFLDGVLLLRWRTTDPRHLPDSSVVFLDCKTGELDELVRIRSFCWNAEKVGDSTVRITWEDDRLQHEITISSDNAA